MARGLSALRLIRQPELPAAVLGPAAPADLQTSNFHTARHHLMAPPLLRCCMEVCGSRDPLLQHTCSGVGRGADEVIGQGLGRDRGGWDGCTPARRLGRGQHTLALAGPCNATRAQSAILLHASGTLAPGLISRAQERLHLVFKRPQLGTRCQHAVGMSRTGLRNCDQTASRASLQPAGAVCTAVKRPTPAGARAPASSSSRLLGTSQAPAASSSGSEASAGCCFTGSMSGGRLAKYSSVCAHLHTSLPALPAVRCLCVGAAKC